MLRKKIEELVNAADEKELLPAKAMLLGEEVMPQGAPLASPRGVFFLGGDGNKGVTYYMTKRATVLVIGHSEGRLTQAYKRETIDSLFLYGVGKAWSFPMQVSELPYVDFLVWYRRAHGANGPVLAYLVLTMQLGWRRHIGRVYLGG